eukprot:536914_1
MNAPSSRLIKVPINQNFGYKNIYKTVKYVLFICIVYVCLTVMFMHMDVIVNKFNVINNHEYNATYIKQYIPPSDSNVSSFDLNYNIEKPNQLQTITRTIKISDDYDSRYSLLNFDMKWKWIFWQHVRKTAGSSLCRLFMANKLQQNTRIMRSWNCRVPGGELSGSRNFSLWKQLLHEMNVNNTILALEYTAFPVQYYYQNINTDMFNNILFITILRSPIYRVFSDLLYRGSIKCHNKSYETSLIECAKSAFPYTENYYIKIFSGMFDNGDRRRKFQRVASNDTNSSYYLNIAKNILHKFDIIIILEQLVETLPQLRCYGIDNTQLQRVNSNKDINKTKLLQQYPKLKQFLIQTNLLDIELYQSILPFVARKSKKCRKYLMTL